MHSACVARLTRVPLLAYLVLKGLHTCTILAAAAAFNKSGHAVWK
jgi:hypothetical protein